jgi:hypothetical protein
MPSRINVLAVNSVIVIYIEITGRKIIEIPFIICPYTTRTRLRVVYFSVSLLE